MGRLCQEAMEFRETYWRTRTTLGPIDVGGMPCPISSSMEFSQEMFTITVISSTTLGLPHPDQWIISRNVGDVLLNC